MRTIITTSVGRPYCFSILEKLVARQTVKPNQWIVVGEDLEGYSFNMGQDVIRRERKEKELPSLCENWLAAIPHIKGDTVIVVEDDDWIHPRYLEVMAWQLSLVQLAGISHAAYYKLPIRKYVEMGNAYYASLACTGFRRDVLPWVERICHLHKSFFIDCYLWAEGTQDERFSWSLQPNYALDGRKLHVGMKMMPGALGLGGGHSKEGIPDPDLAKLAEWIGEDDCRMYREIPAKEWGCYPTDRTGG